MLASTISFKVGQTVNISKFGYSKLQGKITEVNGRDLKVEITGIIFNFKINEII